LFSPDYNALPASP